MPKQPDPNLALAEQLLPVDQLDHMDSASLPRERQIELAQTHALISIARSLRGIEQEGVQTF
jgi:hypothetical protein